MLLQVKDKKRWRQSGGALFYNGDCFCLKGEEIENLKTIGMSVYPRLRTEERTDRRTDGRNSEWEVKHSL